MTKRAIKHLLIHSISLYERCDVLIVQRGDLLADVLIKLLARTPYVHTE